MTAPKALVLRSPGTNCDVETAYAFEQAGGQTARIHINRLLEDPGQLRNFQILCFPGGFSFGDDLGAGRILASKWQQHLQQPLREFHESGKLILGICNGFQVLIKTGLLLADDEQGPLATLTWNDHGRFEDRWVRLTTDGQQCVFLRGVHELELPIAHAEGKFVARSPKIMDQLQAQGQLALRYAAPAKLDAQTAPTADAGQLPFPANPNGSQRNVAGICDATGRVFGLMPHPERFIDSTHHPRWTREPIADPGQGLAIFRNAVTYFS